MTHHFSDLNLRDKNSASSYCGHSRQYQTPDLAPTGDNKEINNFLISHSDDDSDHQSSYRSQTVTFRLKSSATTRPAGISVSTRLAGFLLGNVRIIPRILRGDCWAESYQELSETFSLYAGVGWGHWSWGDPGERWRVVYVWCFVIIGIMSGGRVLMCQPRPDYHTEYFTHKPINNNPGHSSTSWETF